MNQSIKTILTTVIAAAIVGNAAMLFQMNGRLASLETKIEMLTKTQTTNIAKNEH